MWYYLIADDTSVTPYKDAMLQTTSVYRTCVNTNPSEQISICHMDGYRLAYCWRSVELWSRALRELKGCYLLSAVAGGRRTGWRGGGGSSEGGAEAAAGRATAVGRAAAGRRGVIGMRGGK